MKLLLFTFVVCFAAVLAAPADKQKRDILPGDPRYGTEHHHHHHENEVQITKAAGGYVGSYTVPDDTEDHSFQVQQQSKSSYGLPNAPSTPLGTDLFASNDIEKNPASLLIPSTSYGIPDTTQLLNGNFFGSIDDKKPAVVKTTIQEQPNFDTVHLQKSVIPEIYHEINGQQPAIVHENVENIPQVVSLPQAKASTETQGTNQDDILSSGHISSIPSSPIAILSEKDTFLKSAAQSAKATPGLVSSIVSPFKTYPNYVSSYSNIPVKTLDRHVQVHVPHPYHVPVTKHVNVPIPVPHTVEVPKPYYVRVPHPVQVPVDHPYPVAVPRPVPYPVPHYVKTSVPSVYPYVTVDTKANPLQTSFDNAQSTFQTVLSGIPFSNPLEGFSNPFENFDLASYPFLPFIPSSISSSIPFLPQPSQPSQPATGNQVNVFSSTDGDSVTIDNLSVKGENTFTKPIVQPVIKPHTSKGNKPSTACAGCIVTGAATNKQESVQSVDANGGYVY